MSNTTSNATSTKPEATTDARKGILKEIGTKWNKFSEEDLSALKGNDDLVTQVVAKYSLDKAQAQRDVDAIMKGRHI
jgi:hypothetical protein